MVEQPRVQSRQQVALGFPQTFRTILQGIGTEKVVGVGILFLHNFRKVCSLPGTDGATVPVSLVERRINWSVRRRRKGRIVAVVFSGGKWSRRWFETYRRDVSLDPGWHEIGSLETVRVGEQIAYDKIVLAAIFDRVGRRGGGK